MLRGQAKLDIPVYSDDRNDIDQGMGPVLKGIEVNPEDLHPEPGNPNIYRGTWEDPKVSITVIVRPDGSTIIETDPPSDVIENELHI